MPKDQKARTHRGEQFVFTATGPTSACIRKTITTSGTSVATGSVPNAMATHATTAVAVPANIANTTTGSATSAASSPVFKRPQGVIGAPGTQGVPKGHGLWNPTTSHLG